MHISSFRLYAFLLFILLMLTQTATAQRRFGAALAVGLTASQIDGDNTAGYNKLGFSAGARGMARLGPRTELSVELLYSERGAQSEIIRDEFNPFYFSLTTQYIEVPIQFHFKDWLVEGEDEADDYYRIGIGGGLSYGRYMNNRFTGEPDDVVKRIADGYLKKSDISLVLSANVLFTRHIGISLRWMRSLVFMYAPADWEMPPAKDGWNAHSLTFQLYYQF